MRIVFSRKGFDSSYGGAPSPILGGRPVSLPIPASRGETTTYETLGLGQTVADATRGRMTGAACCHDDPMFGHGHCWLGQVGAAQGHLRKNGIGPGDTFLFFGLFAECETGERHHRIFGFMQVTHCGAPQDVRQRNGWTEPPRPHPHFSGAWDANNTIYHGPGALARSASPSLRLTRPGGPLTHWRVPAWLERHGLTYHAKAERWPAPGELLAASRGQEFICDIGKAAQPRRWLEATIAAIRGEDR